MSNAVVPLANLQAGRRPGVFARRAVSAGVFAASVVAATEASADLRGFTWKHATVNGGPRFASDDLNVGLGVNGGYTLDQGVYLGGLFDFFFGESYSYGFGNLYTEGDFNVWLLMFDGGYDIGIGRDFVVRPSLAMGMANAHVEFCRRGPGADGCFSDSNSDFEAALSGNALFRAGALTLGGELRIFVGDYDGVWMGFNIGGVF